VSVFWIAEGYAVTHPQERLLPTGAMDLVIGLDEDHRTGSGISGARSEFGILDTSGPFSAIGAHFKPGGGFPFCSPPAGELQNLGVPLDAVWGRYASTVREQLLEAKTSEARFRILERALLERSAGRLGRHPAVRFALKAFEAPDASPSIAGVTHQIGLSARRFAEVFRHEVGLTPKLFCRIRRFQSVLASLDTLSEINWTDIAVSCGYFDQAHFNHDFRQFCGVNPSTYLRHRIFRNHVAVHD
jgi:methylphosphotriester-DNA--protein-cysteine methyltransferase